MVYLLTGGTNRLDHVIICFSYQKIPYGNILLVIPRYQTNITVRDYLGVLSVKSDKTLPYGNISSSEDLGNLIRAHRKAQAATQSEFAALCGVGVRFISDLENGKPTIQLSKVLNVLRCLGLDVAIQPRGWQKNAQAMLSDKRGAGE